MSTVKAQPDTPSIDAAAMAPEIDMLRDCYAGTGVMRQRGEVYLPKNPREPDPAYERRLAAAVFHNAVEVTIDGAAGMVFRKPILLSEEVPVRIRGRDIEGSGGLWESIDDLDQRGDVFCREWFISGYTEGHAVCFVDPDPSPEGVASRREEGALTPKWRMIPASSILEATAGRVGGRRTLVRLRWLEVVTEEEGEYGQQQVRQVRIYHLRDDGPEGRRVEWKVVREQDSEEGGTTWVDHSWGTLMIARGRPYPEIPAAFFWGRRTGEYRSRPPVVNLAYENIRHYQIVSDNDTCEKIAKVPTFWVAGVSEEAFGKLAVGPNSAWRFDSPDTQVGVLQAEASPSQMGRETERSSEKRMAIHGLALLRRDDVAEQTATQNRLEKSESDARLVAAVDRFQDAVEEALRLTALWLDEADGGSCEVNKDFVAQLLSPQEMDSVSRMVTDGQLSVETMWDILKAGGRLPETFDPEVERMRLAAEGILTPPELGDDMEEEDLDAEAEGA